MEPKMLYTPAEILGICVNVGKGKAALTRCRALWLGIMAGIFIALAGVGATFANVYVNKLAGACVFPGGLAMVLLGGSELFTGNCLMVAALMKKEITLRVMLRNWLFVYLGNLIGAVFVAVCCAVGGTFDAIADTVIATAAAKVSLPFVSALLRGIFCNILVCIAVWMSFGARTAVGKVAALFFPVMLFVVAGFEHSVANMFYLPAGFAMEIRTGGDLVVSSIALGMLRNLIPVTIGNIIGGSGFVAVGYHLVYGKKA
ncbi:MAG: formate/nitrite transporter family protein [Clostridia bacterium]|nr:formate/nitrite transporter family protein [Clostridia bacterium]